MCDLVSVSVTAVSPKNQPITLLQFLVSTTSSYSLNCIGASSADPGELEQVPGWQVCRANMRVKANPRPHSPPNSTYAQPELYHSGHASQTKTRTFPFIICMLRQSVLAGLHCAKELCPDVRQVGLVGNVHTVVQCVSAHNAPVSTGQHQPARAARAHSTQQHQRQSGMHGDAVNTAAPAAHTGLLLSRMPQDKLVSCRYAS
jgi:hypothetical protein